MSYDKEELYKIFTNIAALKELVIGDPKAIRDKNTNGMLGIIDEVLKLRADVEKLKTKQ